MITETIYIAKDRDGNCRYVGRTKLPLARRRQLHAEQLRTDWLACPLYKFMHDEGATFDDENGKAAAAERERVNAEEEAAAAERERVNAEEKAAAAERRAILLLHDPV